MTRQNVILSETSPVENKNKGFQLLEMWCEDGHFPLLGNVVYGGDENDNIQEQCQYTGCEGLVDST